MNFSDETTYELAVDRDVDLVGSVLQITCSSPRRTDVMAFLVADCIDETDGTRVYSLSQLQD